MGMTAGWWAAATGGTRRTLPADTPAGEVVIDSRRVSPGSVFAAIRGEASDGHDYAASAMEAGAAFALVERPVDPLPHLLVPDVVQALATAARRHLADLRATGTMTVAAITGSVGKTTTKDLLARIAHAHGPTVAAHASFNNHLGLPATVLRATAETRYLIVEMGANHLGEIAALATIAPPDVAVILGVGLAHVGEFGSVEAIAQAKAELLAGLRPGGTAVLNADDPLVLAMPGPPHPLTFGANPTADIRLLEASGDGDGHLTLRLATPATGEVRIRTALTGRHHATNVAAAVAAAQALGIPADQAAHALTGVGPASPHRMDLRHTPTGALILDDAYNANPASVKAALLALGEQAARTGRRPIAALGEMRELGEASAQAHRDIGEVAAQAGVAQLIAVGRGARPYADGALGAGMAPGDVLCAETIDDARALLDASTKTVILVKGSLTTDMWRLADALATPSPAPAPASASSPATPAPATLKGEVTPC